MPTHLTTPRVFMPSLHRLSSLGGGLALFALLLFCPLQAGEAPSEHSVRAIFLLNLTRFIRWPESAFASDHAPLTIGVLPLEPVGVALTSAVRGEKTGQHPIVVREIRSEADLVGCQVVFLAQTDNVSNAKWLMLLKTKSILAVGDGAEFLRLGGHVQFFNRHGQVRLRLNLDNLARSNLTVSAQLLRLADVAEN